MEALKQVIPIVLGLSLALLVLAIGLKSSEGDFAYVLRRPGLLAKALIAVCIVPPLAAIAVLGVIGVSKAAGIAILLMAISPVPPLVPGKDLKLGGRPAYVLGLYAALALLSVITVPLLGNLVAGFYGVAKSFPVTIVATNILLIVLVPLLLGILFSRRLAPALSRRALPWIERSATILMLLAFLPILLSSLKFLPGLVGDGTILAVLVVVGTALAAGHLLGGETAADRPALAIAAATRHPGIAMALAGANNEEPRVASAILLFLLVGVAAVIPYQTWIKKRAAVAHAG